MKKVRDFRRNGSPAALKAPHLLGFNVCCRSLPPSTIKRKPLLLKVVLRQTSSSASPNTRFSFDYPFISFQTGLFFQLLPSDCYCCCRQLAGRCSPNESRCRRRRRWLNPPKSPASARARAHAPREGGQSSSYNQTRAVVYTPQSRIDPKAPPPAATAAAPTFSHIMFLAKVAAAAAALGKKSCAAGKNWLRRIGVECVSTWVVHVLGASDG